MGARVRGAKGRYAANSGMTQGQRNFLENSVACVGLGGGAAASGLVVGYLCPSPKICCAQ